MRDNILESIFLNSDLWRDAISHGAEKRINSYCLEELSDPHVRADLCIAIGEQRYKIKIPHTGYCRKDNGSMRMFLANEPQDRVLLNVIYKWLMINESKMIHQSCKSYQSGIGIGKIVKEISYHLKSGEQGNSIVGRKFDIHKYFESIPREKIHEVLAVVENDYGKSSIIDLLRDYYDSDIYFDSLSREYVLDYQGIKQGCAVSSWLANVILYPLDDLLSKRKGLYVRYSDDILYIGDDIEEVTGIIIKTLSQMGLRLNPNKIVDIKEGEYFCFLGYEICGQNITLSHKWVKNFQHEIDLRTIRNAQLISQVRKLHQSTEDSEVKEAKLIKIVDNSVRNIVRYLLYGNGRFSWATEVLPVITNESDLRQLTLYCLDAIRAVYTGRTNIGGLGKSLQHGIQRGKGRNVRSNIVATKLLSTEVDGNRIRGFLSLLTIKKLMSNRWLFRTLAANSVDTAQHPQYGQSDKADINQRNRDELILNLELLYAKYKESIPSFDDVERFYAYSLDEMTPEMLLRGESRKVVLKEFEQFLVNKINSVFLWEDEKQWFWQSRRFPELVLLREWFA